MDGGERCMQREELIYRPWGLWGFLFLRQRVGGIESVMLEGFQ